MDMRWEELVEVEDAVGELAAAAEEGSTSLRDM